MNDEFEQAIIWWRSSKPIGKQVGFAAINGPLFPDYIPQRMRGMAMDSVPLRPAPTRCLKIDVIFFGALEYIMHYSTMRCVDCNG